MTARIRPPSRRRPPHAPAPARFGTCRRARRGWRLAWWTRWRVPVLVTLVTALWWFAVRPLAQTPDAGWVRVEADFSLCGDDPRTRGCVIDGDTVFLADPGSPPRRIRLTGYDAPELDGACEAERALARRARLALRDWLAAGRFEWSGGADPARDRYGRELREARRPAATDAPETLAEAMLDAGLARESGWGADPVDWCG